MISNEQIEEWTREVEQRPSSAPLIIDYISKRLRDLTGRNEELLAENIELRTGRRVEEYEKRIASLEYQLEILKRQMGDFAGQVSILNPRNTASLVLYTHNGRALRVELPMDNLSSRKVILQFKDGFPSNELNPTLLITNPAEELLFIFDSGRTEAYPVTAIPIFEPDQIDWLRAKLVEPRGNEELTTVLPIARMSLYDYCIQVSRRGCVKKMMKSSFEGHIAKNFIGSGVKQKPDRTCSLVFTARSDRIVLVTYEGFLVSLAVENLAYTIEEGMRLATTDHVQTAFPLSDKKTLLVITTSGKVLQKEASWLEPAESFRLKGQPVFSQARREAGNRCAGAALVDEVDWVVLLLSDGNLIVYSIADLYSSGSIHEVTGDVRVLDFKRIDL